MTTTIRAATPDDVGQILTFIRSLAAFEREPDAVKNTEKALLRHGFGPNPFFFCLIAEQDGQSAGFALYFYKFSTFLTLPGIWLEDLFVYPQFRRNGIGRALLQRVANIAVEQGCGRLEWTALEWNKLATDFYKRLGAEELSDWRVYRMTGNALKNLAGPTL